MEALSGISSTWQTWAVDPLSSVLTFIQDVVGSYAIAIVLFTIAIRLLMIPLTLRQIRSQRAMQTLQPEIAQLRKRHKGEQQRVSQEMWKLYKQHGVSPFSGCLPLVIQLPVLLALYGGILTLSSRGLLNEQFLWFNLAREDSTFYVAGEGAPTQPVDVHLATPASPTPLESALAADFSRQWANFRFHIDPIDPSRAAQSLEAGAADAVFSPNRLDPATLPVGTEEVRLVQSAAIVVERDWFLTRMTQTELVGILRGELRNWAELGGPPSPIALHVRRADIGSPSLLSDLLLDGEPIAAPIQWHEEEQAYLDALLSQPGALGISQPIFGVPGLRMLNIATGETDRALAPLPARLDAGEYPLSRDLYAYWAPSAAPETDFLVRWWQGANGQAAAQSAGFTRIPPGFGLFGEGGFYISLLALLAGGFQLAHARMMQQQNVEGQAATMNRVMQFMPIIVVIFAWTFQAGLVLYWVISSIISIVQQYYTTGTGKLIPQTWPLARDVMAAQGTSAPSPEETDGETAAAPTVTTSTRRRRRRRRRGG